jgi:N-acylneuraminate cytidylyltransferase
MNIAVIPARGGSKRIPRKNIREFCGKPMIAWSIAAARQSGCFDRVLVSTDDPEIAAVAERFGAEAPFVRPAELSNDHAGTIPVMRHAVEWLVKQRSAPENICCIYATAPFISPDDIRAGLELLQGNRADFAFSVTTFPYPIQRALRLTQKGRVQMFSRKYSATRSQDLEEAYHDAGQFYWGRAEAWLAEKIIFGPDSLPVILPRHRVQDIDTMEDWRRAELMFTALGSIK